MSDNAQQQLPDFMNIEILPQHEWLARFAGDWTMHSIMHNPDGSTHETRGTESVRMLGGIWYMADGEGEMPGGGMAQMRTTVGYDPEQACFVGSWIGSMMNVFWLYRGQLSEDGNSLHLEAEGPDCSGGEGMKKYRDTIEYVNDGHRRLRSAMQGEDGQWQEFMVVDYHRA